MQLNKSLTFSDKSFFLSDKYLAENRSCIYKTNYQGLSKLIILITIMEKDKDMKKDLPGVQENFKDLSIFEGDQYFTYVYKKAEKITAAVYMVSDFFNDRDPLKTSIRTASLSLIDLTLSLNTTSSPMRKDLLNQIVKQSLGVISYSEIAARAGIESLMNHRILKGELEQFIRTIEEREMPNKLGRHFVLSENFIHDELTLPQLSAIKESPKHLEPSKASPIHIMSSVNVTKHKIVATPAMREQKSSRKNERQDAIVSVIRTKGELSIKDLTGVIKGCSEKTIQRELISLVEAGTLTKVGERRWSRYSLSN